MPQPQRNHVELNNACHHPIQSNWTLFKALPRSCEHTFSTRSYDPDEKITEHIVVLTIGNKRDGQWLAVPALSTPEDIVRTTLGLMGNQAASPG